MAAGSIIVDLLMRTGSFETDTDRAAKVAKKRAKEIESAFKGIGTAIQAGIFGLTISSLFGKFAQESRAAQEEQAQLAAVLKSTGLAAGYTQDQLNDMADAMQRASTFSAGDINKAQTRLLAYTNIVGEKFPEAMQATIDMAARLNISLESSAEAIGKALDVPSQGMSSLSKQGFRFTEDQKKVAQQLEATGRIAEAQKIVLDALESSYGGAAKAARDTFGGATAALQSQLNSLMTGSDGSLAGATRAVNDLTDLLGSEDTRKAFDSFTGGMAKIIEWSVKAGAGFVQFSQMVGTGLGMLLQGADDPIQRIDDEIAELSETMRDAQNNAKGFTAALIPGLADRYAKEAADAAQRIAELQRARDHLRVTMRGSPDAPAAGAAGPALTPITPKPIKSTGSKTKTEAERYLEQLQRQLQATRDLSVAETLLADIQAGRLGKVTPAQELEMLGIAMQIDARRKLEEAIKGEGEARLAATAAAMRADEQAIAETKDIIDGNQGLREEIALIGKDAKAKALLEQARIDNAIAAKEEALAMAQISGASAVEIEALRQQINLLKQRKDLLGQKGVAETLAEDAEKGKQAAKDLGMSFSSAFEDAIIGGNKLRDVFSGLLQDIARIVLRRSVTEPLAAAIGGMDWGSMLGSIFGARANGGPVTAGAPYIVGERGPEMFVPSTSGKVLPNHALRGGSDQPVNIKVVNNTGTQATARQQRGPDGIEIILDAVQDDISRGGRVAQTMQQTYGLSRGAGVWKRS